MGIHLNFEGYFASPPNPPLWLTQLQGFGAQIGFLKIQSQNLAHSQQFQCSLWEKSVKILLKIGSEWEENYSCTNALCNHKHTLWQIPKSLVSIYECHNIDFVFFSPMKVNNSSNSAVFTLAGTGAWGSFSECAFVQFATL